MSVYFLFLCIRQLSILYCRYPQMISSDDIWTFLKWVSIVCVLDTQLYLVFLSKKLCLHCFGSPRYLNGNLLSEETTVVSGINQRINCPAIFLLQSFRLLRVCLCVCVSVNDMLGGTVYVCLCIYAQTHTLHTTRTCGMYTHINIHTVHMQYTHFKYLCSVFDAWLVNMMSS